MSLDALFDHLTAKFRHRPDVYVGRDLPWYPDQETPDEFARVDLLIAFGRPNHPRTAYVQWEEDNVPPTALFEIHSPENAHEEFRPFDYCSWAGVEECYGYEQERNSLYMVIQQGARRHFVEDLDGFTSPRLGLRFDFSGREMVLSGDCVLLASFAVPPAECDRRLRVAAEERAARAHLLTNELSRRLERLARLSRKARRGQATADELAELDRLESESS